MFVKASHAGAMEVKEILDKYCLALGQWVNLDKSSVFFSKRCPETIRQSVKDTLQVPNETLNEKYLGIPSDVGRSLNGAFKYLRDRVWKRIHGWIEQMLSVGGKYILIKSVVLAIPKSSMSYFKLLRGLCLHINSLIQNFWWGSKKGKRRTHWVSWEVMFSPKSDGSLGFRDIGPYSSPSMEDSAKPWFFKRQDPQGGIFSFH
jgi:hypothetical protein